MKTIAYARVSTDEQNTLKQIDALNAWRAANPDGEWELLQDVDVSSKIPLAQRPEGAKIMAAIKAGQCGAVVMHKLDRGFRSTLEFLSFMKEIEKRGVRVVVISLFNGTPLDTGDPAAKLLITVMAAVAEFEREQTAERTRESMRAAMKRGHRTTRRDRVQFGYKVADIVCEACVGASPACPVCRGKGTLPRVVKDTEEQKVIEEIKEMASDGSPATEIAGHLRMLSMSYRNSPWTATRVEALLARER